VASAAWEPRTRSRADTGAPAPTYKVGTITVKFVGTANVNEQVVRANIQVREGGDLDETMLDRDIRALYKTGLFEFIEIKREAVNARTFNLVIEVTPKYRVLAIKYEGNKQVKTRKLEKEVKTAPNTSLDERQVKEDSEKLKEYYQKEGFNQVSISYTIDRDRATGLGTVTFKIREGKKVKIWPSISRATPTSSQGAPGSDGHEEMVDVLLAHGHGPVQGRRFPGRPGQAPRLLPRARLPGRRDPEEKIVFSYPKKDRLVITITVHEGRQYRIGEITHQRGTSCIRPRS
jgi:outer membrane protein insertion porin family